MSNTSFFEAQEVLIAPGKTASVHFPDRTTSAGRPRFPLAASPRFNFECKPADWDQLGARKGDNS